MYQLKVNEKFNFEVNETQGAWTVNGAPVSLDTLVIKDNLLHILHQHISYRVEIVSFSKEEKLASIKVNGHTYSIAIKDRFDDLLHQLGLDNLQSSKVAELKAPMPGLVLSVLVKEGDEVKKGLNHVFGFAFIQTNLLIQHVSELGLGQGWRFKAID